MIWGPLHCNQMRLLWGEEEEEEEEYYVQSYIPLQFVRFFFGLVFVGAYFDAISPYHWSPVSPVS